MNLILFNRSRNYTLRLFEPINRWNISDIVKVSVTFLIGLTFPCFLTPFLIQKTPKFSNLKALNTHSSTSRFHTDSFKMSKRLWRWEIIYLIEKSVLAGLRGNRTHQTTHGGLKQFWRLWRTPVVKSASISLVISKGLGSLMIVF